MDEKKIRADFPLLNKKINGKPVFYLDNAASTQKPSAVLEALVEFYEGSYANIHRGAYSLSEQATDLYEKAREKVARFIGARPDEIVFTKGTTEGINLAAYAWGGANLSHADMVLISQMEHHSNIVPWQIVAKARKARVEAIRVDTSTLCLDMRQADELLAKKPKVLAVAHASNAIGTVNDVARLCRQAKEQGARVLVDAAQSAPHIRLDVGKIGCDFLAFSGHKILGPTGIGVLFISQSVQKSTPPFLGGGDMIRSVEIGSFTHADPPAKYEAGTPPIAQAIGLMAAIGYIEKIGLERVRGHEIALADLCQKGLEELGCTVYRCGQERWKGGIVAFDTPGIHPHDLATILDRENVMVRSGHQCAMPLHRALGVSATARASFYIYNGKEDVEKLCSGVERAKKIFGTD
ncbi:SufS family cysteine desulfurase [Candidatus Parvarchaeota archaeon]|nr:SufS family cysteine desulfurase [Candidatus Parvarchaeota archaeon]